MDKTQLNSKRTQDTVIPNTPRLPDWGVFRASNIPSCPNVLLNKSARTVQSQGEGMESNPPGPCQAGNG